MANRASNKRVKDVVWFYYTIDWKSAQLIKVRGGAVVSLTAEQMKPA